MNKKIKEKVLRAVALYLALNLLAEFIIPIPAHALTGGPSQPEVESFEPVSTTEMVNLFTGDFNYNIPLLTVPGPNGGYPINLAYHAGIGMEQEASWVGLGWNINPGVINRNMRGLPDDFNGDTVIKTLFYKPRETWTMDWSKWDIDAPGNSQVLSPGSKPWSSHWGLEKDLLLPPTFTHQVRFNNYSGLGYAINLNLTSSDANNRSSHFSEALSISYDVDGGLGVSPSVSYTGVYKKSTWTHSVKAGYYSRQGILTLNYSASKQTSRTMLLSKTYRTGKGIKDTKTFTSTHFFTESGPGGGVSFSSMGVHPQVNLPVNSRWLQFGVAEGTPSEVSMQFKKYLKKRHVLSYNSSSSDMIGKEYESYGHLYSSNLSNANGAWMLDFIREKNEPANKNSSAIGLGYAGDDVLSVNGQGISGAFKICRSEIATNVDYPVQNNTVGAKIVVEYGDTVTAELGLETDIGGDYGVNFSSSYSGDWKNYIPELNSLVFLGSDSSSPLYEPVYYRSTGEMLASPIQETVNLSEDEAVRFNLRNNLDTEVGITTQVEDELVEDGADLTYNSINMNNKRTSRQRRSQLLTYRTSGEIDRTVGYGSPVVSLYSINSFPSGGSASDLDYGNYQDHHIGEITVTNPDGARYVYGLPAYNTLQKEVMFTKEGFLESSFNRTETYSTSAPVDNSTANTQGNDHLFMSTEIPDYAYGYLITAIYSADYVDLTGNGPTEDDFGYWVKFNYTPNDDGEYGWRVPYRDANYSKGHISDLKDDKLSYTYGTKEIYYLNSVETKTHEAHFILNDNGVAAELRADGNGVTAEDFLTASTITAGEQQHFLKSIELVGKSDPTTVIKTVHFEYDFTLCGNVDNNITTAVTVGSNNINAEKGKLTLKGVWFSNFSNEKGQLSPYIFSYDEGGAYDNPDYSLDSMDRWGNYMEGRLWEGTRVNCNENPYVNQSAYGNHSDEYASAWNLKKIVLPSGGEINVEYESDDYAYVQDRPAMQMQRLVGTGEYTTVSNGQATMNGSSLGDRNLLLFFELEETFDADELTEDQILGHIEPYVRNVDDLYFKAFLKLKRNPANLDRFSYDYVDGYARIDRDEEYSYGYGQPDGNGIVTTGWVRVKAEERNPWNPIGQTDHPIKLAGWQYMRLERPDLFDDGNLFDDPSNVLQVIQGFVNMANDFQRLFGYFNFCQANGYCNYINVESDGDDEAIFPRPSWLRLNSPDSKKLGGGHRVKQITITDNWENMSDEDSPITATYGTSYQYAMPDGTSSGVAEYEPLIGGEENALRKPLRYQVRKFPYKNDGLYAEEPFGEGLYPAPNVGYRRVVVRSINNDIQPEDGTPNVTVNRTGTTVTEFYTAKDFPVLNDYTDLQKKNFGIPVIIPFIGEISYNNKGYSQGFSLELNNMHGQIKSQAVYAAGSDINNPNVQPTSKAEYIYQTDPNGGPEGKPKLSSRVTVLTQDGVYEDADIGKTHEFYIDRQQHSNFSVSAGLQTNAGAVPPYVFWGNVFPYFEISRSMYRSISTMKIIQRNGVLSEVREYKDGAFTINKTLMYDAETGQPLLTQTINNHNRPVYTYNYASHWAYDGMGPAYKNVGAYFGTQSITSGVLNYSLNAEDYFVVGDEVEMEAGGVIEIAWVSEVDAANDDVTFIDETGALFSSGSYSIRILRSGRRNQQISTNGVIVSLSNPVTDRQSPFFKAMNDYNASALTNETVLALDDFYTDCFTGALMDVDLAWNNTTSTLSILTAGAEGGCEASIVFNGEDDITVLKDLFDYTLFYVAATGQVIATKDAARLTCTFTAPNDCFHTCLDNVLHAEAYRFKDEWDYNYLDFGNPSNDAKGLGGEFMADEAYPNQYRFGTSGIWRMEESWLYQVDRKQSTGSPSMTSVAGDGTYKHFVLHNWASSLNHATQNPQWTLSNTVTQYDPHGYEVENVNPLGVYSSAMYGYGSSMPVAVASNTRLGEMAFEGFEDYANVLSYEADEPHGHCDFYSLNGSFPIAVNSTQAHTGTYGMAVVPSGGAAMEFTSDVSGATRMFNPIGGKKYHVSVWVNAPYGVTPSLVVKNDGTGVPIAAAATIDKSRDAIDGWRQINYDFVAPASTAMRLELTSTGAGTCFFDDLRIQPYTSGMKTYVYNPLTFWLVAELDDRNFATFYNYDEQGALVQVKKETEKGIVTVSTSRSNTKQ